MKTDWGKKHPNSATCYLFVSRSWHYKSTLAVECGLPKLPASQAWAIMMSDVFAHDFTKCCSNVAEVRSSSLSWCSLWSGNHHGGGQFTVSLYIPERLKTAFVWNMCFSIKLFQIGTVVVFQVSTAFKQVDTWLFMSVLLPMQ